LVALDDSLSFSTFQTLIVEEIKKDISGYLDYYCVLNAVDITSFPTDFWNSDTQFSLSMEDYTTHKGITSGLMLSDFTDNGWHTITHGYFTYQLTRAQGQRFYPKVDISSDMGGINIAIEEKCVEEKPKINTVKQNHVHKNDLAKKNKKTDNQEPKAQKIR